MNSQSEEDEIIIVPNPRVDTLFPDEPLNAVDLSILKNGYSKWCHYDLAQLIIKHNVLFKRVSNSGSVAQYYVWNIEEALWDLCDATMRNSAMAEMFKHLIRRVLKHNQLSKTQAGDLMAKYQNIKIVKSICGFFNLKIDKQFEKTLDKAGEIIPISNNKKINLRTKEILPRTYDDYFSYYLEVEYLPDLKDENNTFFIFNKSLWNDPTEFEYWILLNGKVILPDAHDNLVIVWQHPLGGGGKTIWLNCIHHIFDEFITKFTIDIFKKRTSKSKSFELCKLLGRTLAYCEENKKNERDKSSAK